MKNLDPLKGFLVWRSYKIEKLEGCSYLNIITYIEKVLDRLEMYNESQLILSFESILVYFRY